MLGWFILLPYLMVMAVWDVMHRRISLGISLVTAAFLAILRIVEIWNTGETLPAAFLGVLTGVFLLLISYVSQGGIGAGDGLVFVVMGLVLHVWENSMVLLLALTLSGVVGGSLLVLRRVQRKSMLPFVPFILCGYGVMFLWKILGSA